MSTHTPQLSHWRCLAGAALGLALATPAAYLQAGDPLPLPVTKDKVQARTGLLKGGSLFTPAGGGHTGLAGDHAVDFGLGTGPVHVADGAFLNTASQNDEMAFAFWIKNSDIAGNSAFWAYSASSSDGGRGFQAHVPWSNNSIYFDSAGCCGADTQRINGNVGDFLGYSGDVTWWTDQWHFLVFSKKADLKQVWIDGALFLEGSNTAPLPTDFTELFIGAQNDTASRVHGLMDGFSVFGTALSEAKINQLFSGTLPTALPASDKLLAYWDFNDYPGEGQFISFSPAPEATFAAPNLIQVVHVDGATPWTDANISLKVDGTSVTPVLTRDGTTVTAKYVPNPLLAAQVKHQAALTYPGPAGALTVEWEFTVGPYTRDAVAARVGVLTSGSSYTGDAGGRTAQPGDRGVDFGQGTGPVYVPDGAFLNQATANDELSLAVWMKRADIANSTIYWLRSPSSAGGRGWQAHVPYSDNNVYFDTAGCCDGSTQRISASINDFPAYTGDVSYWTNDWHFVVLSKQAELKQVWIDGALFLEGTSTAPLPTDITDLFLGSESPTVGLYHGVMDDFAVFGTALSEAKINQLLAGTLPTALPASDKLLAYWNFNDIPAGGLFVSFTPTPDTATAAPNLVKVVHQQGTTPWDLAQVSLKVDDSPVTASVVRDGGIVTVSYVPTPVFAQKSSHTATLTYPLPDGSLASRTSQFTVGAYTKDTLHQYLGVLTGPAKFTADGEGQSGNPGDYAIDLGKENARQAVHILDASFLNQASANDEIALVGWQKLYQIADSALFWVVSPSSSGVQRGIGTHAPWSNNNLYFDTAGCCDAATQRTTAAMSTDNFPDYSGTVDWWYSWHHIVFQKKASTKEIWIDGKLFTTGDNSGVLPTDFTTAYLGFNPADNATMRGLVDEVAMFKTALSEADIVKLAGGAAPTTLPAATGILAYWNFNDAWVPAPTLSIARDGANVRLTWTGTLQSTGSLPGTWTDVTGVSSPATIPAAGAGKYYRAKQ
jgi:hypothetical protein